VARTSIGRVAASARQLAAPPYRKPRQRVLDSIDLRSRQFTSRMLDAIRGHAGRDPLPLGVGPMQLGQGGWARASVTRTHPPRSTANRSSLIATGCCEDCPRPASVRTPARARETVPTRYDEHALSLRVANPNRDSRSKRHVARGHPLCEVAVLPITYTASTMHQG
jgi:hypothetical protein